MKIECLGLAASLLIVPACASTARDKPVRTYLPSEVVENIAALRGWIIRVTGYLVRGDEARALWDSKQDSEQAGTGETSGPDPRWDHCITAYFDRQGAASVGRRPNSQIEAIGKMEIADPKEGVDLWACNEIYIMIHKVIPSRDETRLSQRRTR